MSAAVNATVGSRNSAATEKPKRKRGAQPDNRNRLRHGLYAAKAGAVASVYANRQIAFFRRAIEDAVVSVHGEITVLAAALINSSVEAARCAVANREILASLIDPKVELRLAMDREFVTHLDRRDRKLKELGLSLDDIGDVSASSAKGQAGEPRGLSAVLKILDASAVAPSDDEPSEPPTPAGPPPSDRGTAAPGEPPGGNPPLLLPRY